ncbi:MAG: GNAT family N-acetyltransferase [Bacteroidia bacterium]
MTTWTYISHKSLDPVEWDSQLHGQPGSSIYMLSTYLDEIAPSWGYLQSDQGVRFPICIQKKWGIRQIRQPLFSQHFSPIYPPNNSEFELSSLLKAISDLAPLADIQIDLPAPISLPKGWKNHERITYRLPLPEKADQLQKAYSSHHRRILKKNEDIQLGPSKNQEDFIQLLKTEMPTLTGLRAEQFEVVNRLVTWLSIKRRGQLFTATDGDQLLAACYILHSGNRLLYQWAVSSASGKQRQAMHRLIDHVLCEYAGSGLEFDFEGSMLPGLQRFYAGFGAKPYLYMRLTHSKFPAFLNRLLHVG